MLGRVEGKDQVAQFIQELQPDKNWDVRKWAGKLRAVAAVLLNMPVDYLYTIEFKERNLGPSWGNMTGRDFLQKLGTDAIRDGLYRDAWVSALIGAYTNNQNWIISDTRFPNELEAVKRLGGITIRIERTGVGPVNNHPSETAIDNAEYDYKIANVSDLASLKQSVEVVLNKIYARTT